MADRPVRRTLRRTRNTVNGTGKPIVPSAVAAGDPTDGIPVTISDDGRVEQVADGASDQPANEPDGPSVIGTVEVDPERIDAYIADAEQRNDSDGANSASQPRATRRARGPNKARSPQTLDVAAINMMFVTFSVMLKTPELALDPTEAKQLADTYNEFAKHHEIPVMNAKRMSELNLGGAVLTIIGPRLMGLFLKKKHNGPQRVEPIRPAQPAVN
jgi:hypothetical protein